MRNREKTRLGRLRHVEELTSELFAIAERLAEQSSIDGRRVFRRNLLSVARQYGYAVRSLSLGVR